jgi:hypothetical protein
MLAAILAMAVLSPQQASEHSRPNAAKGQSEEFRSLVAAYRAAAAETGKQLDRVATQGERDKLTAQTLKPRMRAAAQSIITLAHKNPDDPAAFEALAWVAGCGDIPTPEADQALALLEREGRPSRHTQRITMALVPSDELARALPALVNSKAKGSQILLRGVADHHADRAVRGLAAYCLGRYLQVQSENQPADSPAARELSGRAEQQFEFVIAKYGDVHPSGPQKAGKPDESLADAARRDLFEIRYLSVGRPAPDIDGDDIEGKHFKLSDYRGKVVLLDFWGQW